MPTAQHTDKDHAGRELIITRLLNAPRALVWEVWTNPEHIKNWWGPDGFTNTIFTMDLQVGGVWDLVMHGPDGTDFKNKSVFTNIIKPERIEFDHISAPKFHVTISFEAQGNKTLLTWHMLFRNTEEFNQTVKVFKADEGLKQNVAKLERYLASTAITKELTLTRTIEAPIDSVFKAWTDAVLLSQWWGPSGYINPICTIEAKIGGVIYIEMQAPDGTVYPMNGNFIEIIVPERLAFSSGPVEKNGSHPFEALTTVIFIDKNGQTEITVTTELSKITPEAAPYLTGMNEAWTQSLDRLKAIF